MQNILIYDVENLSIDSWHEKYRDKNSMECCLSRERWIELSYLKEMGLPFLFSKSSRVLGSYFLKDLSFYDSEENSVKDLSSYQVLFRSLCGNVYNLINKSEELGAKNLIDSYHEKKVCRWTDFVDDKYKKRKISRFKSKDLFDNKGDIDRNLLDEFSLDNKVFIKTEKKGHHGLINLDDIYSVFDIGNNIMVHTGPESDILISEPICFNKDEKIESPNLEYRCFIMQDEILNVSRYIDYDIDYDIPLDVINFVDNFIANNPNFCFSYVLDVGIDENRGPLVVELNSFQSSGRYERNNFEDIIRQFYNKSVSKDIIRKVFIEDANRQDMISSQSYDDGFDFNLLKIKKF